MATREGVLTKRIYDNFAGGVNRYLGVRQVKDNESPLATNCDFKGRSGVGNRQGYTETGSVTDSRTEIWGMAEYHTSTLDQLIKFASNGSNVALYHSTGGDWTAVTGTTFNDNVRMDVVQAVASSTSPYTGEDGTLFSFNGVNTMVKYNGTSWSSHTGAATLLYGAYFDRRLWGVDPTYKDTLKFSTQTPDGTKTLDFVTNGTSSNPGTVTFEPGSGVEIVGIKVWKNALYVWTHSKIYSIVPASSANTFTVTLVTAAVGCVSHRSIAVVENDVFFAAKDGVYSLGEVANYASVRATNKSLRVQDVFDALTGAHHEQLVGRYFNYKYHLFYPQYGGTNDSCLVYDIRYQAWQDWTNIAAADATTYDGADGDIGFYFGEPDTGEVHQLYSGTTDNGTAITSTWYSKSFDEGLPDTVKLYFDHTAIFGDLGGSVTFTVVFNDSEVSSTATLSQSRPQGGIGRGAFGRYAFGKAANSITVTQTINQPQRLRAKGQKFAVQYRIVSTGAWRLDTITNTFIPFNHYKFPSANKLN